MWAEKVNRLETLGTEYIDALEVLRRIVPELGGIARDMEEAVQAGDLATLNAAGAFRVANGLVVRSLRVLEGIDSVPEPILALMKTINPVRKSRGKVEIEEGPGMKKKTFASLIPSTGDDMRDKSVRVLAHSMVTATTAVDAAREIEITLYQRYCTDGPNNDYYDKVRKIYEALSPRSETCRPILRHMLLIGMISPSELVLITAEDLRKKEQEAERQLLQCNPGWLADQLRR